MRKVFFCLLFFLASGFFSAVRGEVDASPFWRSFRRSDGAQCRTFLGPVGEISFADSDSSSVLAVRPFWTRQTVPSPGHADSVSTDVLWPFLMFRDAWHGSTRWVVFFYQSEASNGRGLVYVLPFWFCGTDASGRFSWAFFPFYGDINHFLTCDRMRFLFFPLYWETWKGGSHGLSFLWPLVNMDNGPSLRKFRVLPFYAYSNQADKRINSSILWPFWSSEKIAFPKVSGDGWMLWPFFGQRHIGNDLGYSVCWPFFSWNRDSGKKDSFRINAPMPFFRYGKNQREPGDDIFFLWPFYGNRSNRNVHYRFVLWPLFWQLENTTPESTISRNWIFPFYRSRLEFPSPEKVKERVPVTDSKDFWPIAVYSAKGGDFSVRTLNLFPARGVTAIERNFSPLWTLFSCGRKNGKFRLDFLWGLVSVNSGANENGFAFPPLFSRRSHKDHVEYGFLFDSILFRAGKLSGERPFRLFYVNF